MKHLKTHKIIFVVLILILLLSSVFLLIINTQSISKTDISPNEKNGTASSQSKPFNPLIDQSDIDRVKEGFAKQYEKYGAKPPVYQDYHFKYKISPSLKKPNVFNFILSANAATNCSPELPSSVPAYKLQNNIGNSTAKKIAKEFDITGDASSIPTDDGVSFQYYYTSKDLSSYITITQPSGTYQYHKATKDTSGNSTLQEALNTTEDELSNHNLKDKLVQTSATYDAGTKLYSIHYDKNYKDYKMVDILTMKGLGLTQSLCTIKPTSIMNYIESLITKKNQVYKLINKTRKVEKEFSVKTQHLEDSVKEYEVNPPIPPVVIGSTTNTNDSVTIDEAIPVWYEYGDSYKQKAYILMYLTSGRTSDNSRVLTLFPASSQSELEKNPDLLSSSKLLQLDSFTPPPPASFPSSGTGLCFGNQVDYTVSCSSNGITVCSTFAGIHTSTDQENDPLEVCKKGCQNKEEAFDSESDDPCREMLEKQGIDTSNGYIPSNANLAPGKQVVCKLSGCPC